MAGHSKWANIQHRKNAQDKKRGKIFTRLIREISVAARAGGGDPAANPRLRLSIDKAFAANMPRDTVDRAIKKATGELAGVEYEQITYEGYGPGGVAVLVDCLTDNRNRTVAEVRHTFSKCGGNLGSSGSVSYLFRQQGVLDYPPGTDEAALIEAAVEAGALDVKSAADGMLEVLTQPGDFLTVKQSLIAAGFVPANAEVTMRAEVEVELDVETAKTVIKLIDQLEDLDDTQNVWSNAGIPDEAWS